jgi:uridine kinase
MIIGICGGSGSGKTTLLRRISTKYAELNPTIFSLDNYYLPIEKQLKDENGEINFDLPTALDEEKLTSDLKKLVNGESIEVKEYFFNAPPNKNVLITLESSPLIIVEGLFLFYFKGVRELLDYTIFIDVDPNVQLDRRLYRDQESRGYSRESILYQWKNHVLPCFEKYVHPYENSSDFRFRNDHRADEDFDKLVIELNKRLDKIDSTV